VSLVLDASVALAWLLEDAGLGQNYARQTFQSLATPGAQAWVPALWGLEVGNVLVRGEARGTVPSGRMPGFLHVLSRLPLRVDDATADRALRETLSLARLQGLSTYDASYLELAQRLGLPLATLDHSLQEAANSVGVSVFTPPNPRT
jgi:predicted nucleic acid-binding protein